MPRSLALCSATLLAVLFLVVAPTAALALEPDAAPYLDAAEQAGLPCTDFGITGWFCSEPIDSQDDRSFVATVEIQEGGGFVASVSRSWADVRPLEPDVLELMDRYIVLALGDDADARAWLRESHDGRLETAHLDRGNWSLDWGADWEDPSDELQPITQLHLTYNPAADSPSEQPSGDSEVAEWSTTGRSTYTGTWTATAYAFDGESSADGYHLGDQVEGTVVIDCIAAGASCDVEGTFDGEPSVPIQVRVIGDGVLHDEFRTETDGCIGGQILARTVDAQFGPGGASVVDAFVYEPRTCDAADGTVFSTDLTWTFSGSLTGFVSSSVAAPQGPVPSPVEPAQSSGAVEPFADSIPAVSEISTDPTVVAESVLLAALIVFLMPFPGQLFNSTLEANEVEVRSWLSLGGRGAPKRLGTFWASWPGVVCFTLLAALLYGFLDPTFGLNRDSLATLLGMFAGIVLVTVAFAVPLVVAHRRIGDRFTIKVVPISLLIGLACVLISRATGFQPGYLYGLLIGLAFAHELSAAQDGRATAVGASVMLAVALIAWVALGAIPDSDTFGIVVGRTALAALMVGGLEGVAFGLLPMRFLPGEVLYRWNRVVWGTLLLVGAFAFFHILINPASGYLADSSRTPLLTVLALLIGFALISVAFWAWFRFRTPPGAAALEPENN